MSITKTVVVHSIKQEAKDVISLDLRPCNEDSLPSFNAGAHIDLHLSNGMIRSYSLANSPEEHNRYLIGVLRDPSSRGGSLHVHDTVREGDTLEIGLPRNNFPLVEDAPHTVLVVGGIGVTPLLSMMHRLCQLERSFEVMYFCRSRESAAFLDEIQQFQVKTHLHFDDEAKGPPDLKRLLGECAGGPSNHYYACGPAPMLDAFVEVCRDLGYANAHIERFAAVKSDASDLAEQQTYKVDLLRSGQTLTVDAGRKLIDVLVEAKVDIGFSCKEGVCGACEVEVLEGTPDHRDSLYSPDEHAANRTMMVCVSGCKSPRLVLNL